MFYNAVMLFNAKSPCIPHMMIGFHVPSCVYGTGCEVHEVELTGFPEIACCCFFESS